MYFIRRISLSKIYFVNITSVHGLCSSKNDLSDLPHINE